MAIEGKMKNPTVSLTPTGKGAVLLKIYDTEDPATFMEVNLSEDATQSLITYLAAVSAMK